MSGRNSLSKQPKVEKADLLKAKIDLGIMRYQLESAKVTTPVKKTTKVSL